MNPQAIPVIQPLKKSFVIVALIFLFIGFGIEYGGPNIPFFQGLLSQSFLPTPKEMKEKADEDIDKHVKEKWKNGEYPSVEEREIDRQDLKGEAYKEIEKSSADPPGYSLEADGLYLWVVFSSILLSLIGMLIAKASVHRVGMIISLINSIIVVFMSIFLIVQAILKLIIMIILFMVGVPPIPPVILYIAIYGSFPTLTVLTLGGLGLLCKIVAAILLWIGGSQMIRIKSATLLLITGFVTFFVIEFGLGLAGPFASIADAVIGIIIAIVVIIWSIFMLIGSIRGLLSK